jgi:hypothetical protein
VATILVTGFAGDVTAAIVMRLCLVPKLSRFNSRWNKVFSSIRLQDYKNLPRLRIDAQDGLQVHALSRESVPRDRGQPGQNIPHVHLIESSPSRPVRRRIRVGSTPSNPPRPHNDPSFFAKHRDQGIL